MDSDNCGYDKTKNKKKVKDIVRYLVHRMHEIEVMVLVLYEI